MANNIRTNEASSSRNAMLLMETILDEDLVDLSSKLDMMRKGGARRSTSARSHLMEAKKSIEDAGEHLLEAIFAMRKIRGRE